MTDVSLSFLSFYFYSLPLDVVNTLLICYKRPLIFIFSLYVCTPHSSPKTSSLERIWASTSLAVSTNCVFRGISWPSVIDTWFFLYIYIVFFFYWYQKIYVHLLRHCYRWISLELNSCSFLVYQIVNSGNARLYRLCNRS